MPAKNSTVGDHTPTQSEIMTAFRELEEEGQRLVLCYATLRKYGYNKAATTLFKESEERIQQSLTLKNNGGAA